MSSEAPALAEPKDILPFRKHIFDWLGFYSFVLRLGKEERKTKELANHEKNQQEFRTTYTTPSYHHLQQDVYLALKRILGKSIMVSNLFNQVTTETSNCASAFWDLLLKTFPPSSPQVVAGLIAAAAGSIMRGPDHNSVDPDTDAAANVGTVATAPTSSESRHALQVYHAAVDDLETSAADIAFLRSIFETERQADFDRANPAAYAAFTGAAYIDFSDQD
jgi:hypothetical protein